MHRERNQGALPSICPIEEARPRSNLEGSKRYTLDIPQTISIEHCKLDWDESNAYRGSSRLASFEPNPIEVAVCSTAYFDSRAVESQWQLDEFVNNASDAHRGGEPSMLHLGDTNPIIWPSRDMHVRQLKPPSKRKTIYVWECCQCGRGSINIQIDQCPECQNTRCAYCQTTKVQVR
ncbi:hypothetical protein DL95DRAFT_138726 [Leptodontidium sp. 2 PMI_412]|nr:hypothetical protein DL95DRAFT_138726 [Leptodontidium sp. 2 PMI_412]